MLRIEVLAYPDKSLEVSGTLVGDGEAGEMGISGAPPGTGLRTSRLTQMRESQNTQSPRLRFRALLTKDGDRNVQLHKA
jgi:hypothetical protein